MRGHRVYIGLGDCPQEAAQKCLSKIVGQEVRGTLSESQLDAIFSNDLVSDEAPNQEFPQTRRGKTEPKSLPAAPKRDQGGTD